MLSSLFAASLVSKSWAPCSSEALDLSKSFKPVQGQELDSTLVGPFQLSCDSTIFLLGGAGSGEGAAAEQCQGNCSHPCRYWKLDPSKVYATGPNAWDTAVHDASEEYKHRMVQLLSWLGGREGVSPQRLQGVPRDILDTPSLGVFEARLEQGALKSIQPKPFHDSVSLQGFEGIPPQDLAPCHGSGTCGSPP